MCFFLSSSPLNSVCPPVHISLSFPLLPPLFQFVEKFCCTDIMKLLITMILKHLMSIQVQHNNCLRALCVGKLLYMNARCVFTEVLGSMTMLEIQKSCQCWLFFNLDATCCFLAMYFALPSIYSADKHFRECFSGALGPLRIVQNQIE